MNDIQYPQEGSRLLIEGAESTFMPSLERIPARGYMNAGHILVDHLLENGRQDSLVHPVLFCYRQYLELALKDMHYLIHSINRTTYKPHKDSHDLAKSWFRFRLSTEAVLVGVEGQGVVSTINTIEGYIRELSDYDEGGTLFRYQNKGQGGYTKQRNISLSNLRDRMQETANWLDSLYDWWEATYLQQSSR